MTKGLGTFSLMALLSDLLPEEELINQIETGIIKYKEKKLLNESTEDAKREIIVSSMILMQKEEKGSVIEKIEDFEKLQRAKNLLEPGKG